MNKEIFNVDLLKGEVLKELDNIPEILNLAPDEREILESLTEEMIKELSQLPFLDGIKKQRCLDSIKIAEGALLDIATIKRLQARKAVIMAVESVLTRLVKIVLTL